MLFISERHLKTNLKKYGFSSVDSKSLETINKTLSNFAHNSLKKVANKNKKLEKIELRHVQSGGKIVLPSEYFGVNSGRYFDQVDNVDFRVTEDYIRPPLHVNDPAGVIQDGGASRFKVSNNAFKSALEEAQSNLNLHEVSIASSAKKALQQKYEKLLHEALSKLSKQEEELSASKLNEVLRMRKFSQLQ